jgi:TPR repeat protein
MSVKAVLKSIFSIPMILLYILIYVFRFELAIFALSGYTHYFSTGKAFSERLLGEFYFTQAQRFDLLAKGHFDQSLILYTKYLDETKDPDEKGRVEMLIGSQYECGKGVSTDFNMAKQWYKAASQHGNIAAQEALQKLEARAIGSETINPSCAATPSPGK